MTLYTYIKFTHLKHNQRIKRGFADIICAFQENHYSRMPSADKECFLVVCIGNIFVHKSAIWSPVSISTTAHHKDSIKSRKKW